MDNNLSHMNKKASYFSYPSYFVNPNSKKAPSNSIQVTDSVRGSLKNMHEKEKKQNYIGGAGFGALGGLISGLNLHEQKKTDLLFQNLGNPGAIKNPKM